MQVTVTPQPEASEVEVKLVIEPKEFEPYVRKAAEKLSTEKPLKGFRPGKAPVEVVEETFGKERLLHDAADEAIPHFFVKALVDEAIEALGNPKITISKLTLESGVEFTGTVAVLPEVTLGDVSAISVEKRPTKVDDEDIERELAYIAKTRSQFIDVARPAEEGDTVTVDFKVSMDGAVMEGGESKNHPVHIGEGHFVPDFENKLKGIVPGDEREFSIGFPEDYARKELQGKEAQVWVKAHSVQQRVLPELNDEFAKQLGKFDSLDALKNTLKQNMVLEKEQKERERYQSDLTKQLAEGATFGMIPDVLIEREIDRRMQEFEEMLSMQQKTLDEYAAQNNKTMQQIRDDLREVALEHIKIGLAMRRFSDQEKIEVSPEEVEAKVNEYLQRYKSADQAKQEIDVDELRNNMASMIRNQKTLSRLEETATITEVPPVNEKPEATADTKNPTEEAA